MRVHWVLYTFLPSLLRFLSDGTVLHKIALWQYTFPNQPSLFLLYSVFAQEPWALVNAIESDCCSCNGEPVVALYRVRWQQERKDIGPPTPSPAATLVRDGETCLSLCVLTSVKFEHGELTKKPCFCYKKGNKTSWEIWERENRDGGKKDFLVLERKTTWLTDIKNYNIFQIINQNGWQAVTYTQTRTRLLTHAQCNAFGSTNRCRGLRPSTGVMHILNLLTRIVIYFRHSFKKHTCTYTDTHTHTHSTLTLYDNVPTPPCVASQPDHPDRPHHTFPSFTPFPEQRIQPVRLIVALLTSIETPILPHFHLKRMSNQPAFSHLPTASQIRDSATLSVLQPSPSPPFLHSSPLIPI